MTYGDNSEKGITAGPHALTSINTPMGYQPSDQSISYTYFNKVEEISQSPKAGVLGAAEHRYTYKYGIDKQRRKTTYSTYCGSTGISEVLRTKYYLGNYEKVIENGVTKEYNYLSADAGLFGIFVSTDGDDGELKYVLTDHLGSLTGIVDATSGAVEHSTSFDAWGNLRDSEDWTSAAVNRLFADRGFTGHEHLPEVFGLIDMNGRMYDPVVGRFLSPDPYVQASGYSQSFNRYSYCLNNPLLFTDPSGYKWDLKGDDWYDWLNPFIYVHKAVGALNDNTEGLRQKMVDAGVPDFNAGYNTSKGFGCQVGDNSWVYPNEVVAINNGVAAAGYNYDDDFGLSDFSSAVANSERGLSSSVIASFTFAGVKKVSETGYSIINNEFLRQNMLVNKVVPSLKVGKGVRLIGSYGGYVTSTWGLVDIEMQYKSGKITRYERNMEQIGNAAGAHPIYGTPFTLGWEIGRKITKTAGYQNFKADLYSLTGGYYNIPIRYRKSLIEEYLEK